MEAVVINDDKERKEVISSVSMTVILVSFSMLFATLFLTYSI